MLQSFHQSSEQFEIMFNKTKYNALPPKLKFVIDNAVEAASADMSWKAVDRYSKDYRELATKDGVKFYKTPDTFLQEQLKVWDEVVAKKREGNPLFAEVEKSMRAFAERAMKWDMDTNNPRRMAYNHYFGSKKPPEKKA
jgi:TRAP-type mannitol/chloroaromatic compound transport system substrate-binding protein